MLLAKNNADYFTCKKNRITFFIAIMVFTTHISVINDYELSGLFGDILKQLHSIINCLSAVAVPLFFVISGALFYKNYNYKMTISKYKSRFHSLVIPYLIWNTIGMVFSIACTYTFVSRYFVNRNAFQFSFLNVFNAIFFHKENGQFWFIFDLIVFTLFCPVIYTILKNRIIGLVAIILSVLLYLYGFGTSDILFRNDSIIFYFVGSYIGIHYFDLFYNRSSRKTQLFSVFLFIISYIYIYIIRNCLIDKSETKTQVIILIIYALSVWYLFDLFSNKSYYLFEKESFLIYAMHINVASIIKKLLYIVLPKNQYFAPINYIFTIILTLALICGFGYYINLKATKVKRIICGR